MFSHDVSIGHHTCKGKCDIHDYGGLTGKMRCRLYQEGEPRGYINADLDAEMRVKFCLDGHLRQHLCGKLCVSVHIECLGPGPEITLPKAIQDMDPCGDGCYKFKIPIPAGTLTPDENEECGQVCCFVVTLTSLTPCEPHRTGHIHCFCKGPCVMVHSNPN